MPKTQKEQVIEYMREKGSITQLEAYKLGYIMRLSGIIWTLKHKEGYNIKSKMEQNPETKKVYARYYLDEE